MSPSAIRLGEILSLGGKKYWESNIGDSDNIGDGDTTVEGGIYWEIVLGRAEGYSGGQVRDKASLNIKSKGGGRSNHYVNNPEVLADFIAERPDKDGPPTRIQVEKNIPEPWTFLTDGSSCLEGSGAILIITNPEGMKFVYA
ncbi:hypothetical protein Tco_0405601 [Tanacetum coccineum]